MPWDGTTFILTKKYLSMKTSFRTFTLLLSLPFWAMSIWAFQNGEKAKVELVSTSVKKPCPQELFVREFNDGFSIQAQYFECEPDFKRALEIFKDGQCIYQAEPHLEFEFGEEHFTKLIKNGNAIYLLFAHNRRPSAGRTVVVKIEDNKVDSTLFLPELNVKGKDLDGDNQLEYWGTWEHDEFVNRSELTYNPFWVFEIDGKGVLLDSLATVALNSSVYGGFYGFQEITNDTLLFDADEVFSRWP